MKDEQYIAKALERVGEDRYLLSTIVFERVKELSKGAKPLVDMDLRKHKFADIALREVAAGLVGLDRIEDVE